MNPKCIVPGCGRDAALKGICHNCHAVAQQYVKNGTVTWEELAAKGLCYGTNPMDAAIKALKK